MYVYEMIATRAIRGEMICWCSGVHISIHRVWLLSNYWWYPKEKFTNIHHEIAEPNCRRPRSATGAAAAAVVAAVAVVQLLAAVRRRSAAAAHQRRLLRSQRLAAAAAAASIVLVVVGSPRMVMHRFIAFQ